MQTKKTLLITLEYPPMVGGVANYYHNLVRHLPQESILILDNEEGKLLSDESWVWPKWLLGLWNSYKAVKQNDIEHILVGQILPIGTIALILKIVFGVPYTVMTHAMDVTLPFGTDGSARKQKLIQAILKHADSITTVSMYTRLYLSEIGVSPRNITMVYPCPNVSERTHVTEEDRATFHAQNTFTQKPFMLTVCRLVPRKGVDHALRAFARFAQEHPEYSYVIVGDGPQRKELEHLARQLGIHTQVHFVGKVPDMELALWYASCTFFVMPCRQLQNNDVEGFGITFLEANSFGKAVIGGKTGGVPDAVVDGETGFLVDPEDIDMIAKAMQQLFQNPEKAATLGEHGRKRVQEFFQWSMQAEHLQYLLRTDHHESS